MVFGIYLLVHFGQLLPWGRELFSDRGMLGDPALSPLYPLFPNILFVADSPAAVTTVLVVAMGLSALYIIGLRDRGAAIGLWYIWACLLGRNPLILNPSIPFVGWILLAHSCLPRGPAGSLDGRMSPALTRQWRFPAAIFAVAWIVMSVGYTYSGLTKLGSPSWLNGTALFHVLGNPLARPTLVRDLLLSLPDVVLRVGTWGGLALEVLFAPLALVSKARPVIWAAMFGIHVGLMVLVDFPDLSLGMILLHAFTFDPGWISHRIVRASGIRRRLREETMAPLAGRSVLVASSRGLAAS